MPMPQGVADKLSGELTAKRRGSRDQAGRFWTTTTIAAAVGCTERTIYNTRRAAAKILERVLTAG